MFYGHLSATHHSLLAKLGQWGWLMRMKLAWKISKKTLPVYIHQKDYIKIRLETPGVRAKFLIPNFAIIGNCRLGNGQGHHSLEGVKFIPRHTTYHRTVGGWETPVQGLPFCLKIIYNGPPSRPHQVAFTTCMVRGAYYYPDPQRLPVQKQGILLPLLGATCRVMGIYYYPDHPQVLFNLDPRLEPEYIFAPFRDSFLCCLPSSPYGSYTHTI